jgi:cytochrome P450
VKELLLTNAQDYPKGALQVEILKPMFGNAMISAEGHDWRWQRRVAAPLFHHDELMHYGPVITAAADATVATWKAAPGGTVHAINSDMMRAAFRIISGTMLAGGTEGMFAAIERGHAGYYKGANWSLIYILLGLPKWLPRPGGQAMQSHENRLRGAVAEIVRARRNEAAESNDLLGRLIRGVDPETGRSMSDELLVDNIVALLMAGYDTTAFILTWTLYLISQSAEWEQRMLDEISRVAGGAPITAEHVKNLVIVQQVLNESMRLFPTAPIIVRDIVADLHFNGLHVPAGTIGIIPIYAIHRHRSYWQDPDRFDPGRFSPQEHAKQSRFHFMPFGAGPRICIGAAFAVIEATIMLATFIRAARFELAAGFSPEPSASMFLLPKNGMQMRVTIRERVN